MSGPDGPPAGLEVEDDPRFHRRMWRTQRVGWAAMVVITLVALTGLLGPGPLSTAVTAHPGGLRVEHPRFARADAPRSVRVHLPVSSPQPGGYRVALGRPFLDRVRIEKVVPEPIATETASDDRVAYVFAGAAAPVVTFHFTPRGMGVVRAEISAPGTPAVPIWMLVYP
jgi:hypothetical protein